MNELFCPYCGAEQELTNTKIPNPYDLVFHWECDECGKTFDWHTELEIVVDTEVGE